MSRTGNGLMTKNVSHIHLLFKQGIHLQVQQDPLFPFVMEPLELRLDLPLEDSLPSGVRLNNLRFSLKLPVDTLRSQMLYATQYFPNGFFLLHYSLKVFCLPC